MCDLVVDFDTYSGSVAPSRLAIPLNHALHCSLAGCTVGAKDAHRACKRAQLPQDGPSFSHTCCHTALRQGRLEACHRDVLCNAPNLQLGRHEFK